MQIGLSELFITHRSSTECFLRTSMSFGIDWSATFQSPACLSLTTRSAPRLGGSGGGRSNLGFAACCNFFDSMTGFSAGSIRAREFCPTGACWNGRSPTLNQAPPITRVVATRTTEAIFGVATAIVRMTPPVRRAGPAVTEPAVTAPFVARPFAAVIT